MCAFAVTAALVLSQSANAQSLQKGDLKGSNQHKGATPQSFDVEVNGNKGGTVQLPSNGKGDLSALASGHRVSLLMKNGTAAGAQAVDAQGNSLPTEVHNSTAARRTIIIIIHDGGTVIVIVIRQRIA
jgi:hypothetical protein